MSYVNRRLLPLRLCKKNLNTYTIYIYINAVISHTHNIRLYRTCGYVFMLPIE